MLKNDEKLFYILSSLLFLSSCGPHRMSCGACGICETPEKQEVQQPVQATSVKV